MHRRQIVAQERLERLTAPSLVSADVPSKRTNGIRPNVAVDCGWGMLLFGQTFTRHEEMLPILIDEPEGRRNIAFYVWDPQVLVSLAPDRLFMDPSVTYRLWLHEYRPSTRRSGSFYLRPLTSRDDALQVNDIYERSGMVVPDPDVIVANQSSRVFSYMLAVASKSNEVIGCITGIDHKLAFDDPENGASFWSLAVDPGRRTRGAGRALVRYTAEHYLTRGRQYLDLSVLYDNKKAIRLYRSLRFRRVPVFAIKCKNRINRPLYEASVAA